MEPLQKILDIFQGNKSALARAVADLSGNPKFVSAHVNNMLERDKKVSAEYVLCFSEVSNWVVRPHELRPDLYPHEEDGLPEELRSPREKVA